MAGPEKPDRSAFARRHAIALVAFFLACLVYGGWAENTFAALAGAAGTIWVAWAHLDKR